VSETESRVTHREPPSLRAIRIWTGLLLAVLLVIQMLAVCVTYYELRYHVQRLEHDTEPHDVPGIYWHRLTVATGEAVLAMVFIVGGVGLILDLAWVWRLILVGAVVQIVSTVATQVWQATLPASDWGAPGMGAVGAVIGILIWNVVPVGILILAIAGGKRRVARRESSFRPE